jgi:RHS repeat-associated protein
VNGTSTPGTVYNYTIGSGGASGYAANGNLVSYTDLMNGGWSLSYDNVNRVSAATATSGVWNNLTLSWTYDSFGNRKTQTPSGQNIAAPVPQAQTLNYPSQNRISNYGISGYDAAGNVLYDQINNYLYDAEGRLCAVSYFDGMTTKYMLYLYDGEGRRVAKVSNPTFSCTPASTGSILQETYLLGPSGEHITELGQAGAFLRSNVYANGQLLATYTNNGTYFSLNDWLGSKRVVAKYDGTVAQMCMNLPFGDDLMCSATDLSEHHFTGQIYDQETKNDYFDARYYSNNTGRFLSPDPSGLAYADPTNPQSLNLYSYALNNPLINIDPTGMECVWDDGSFDSADDAQTGNAAGCSGQGGHYVDPSLFENATLTNGQQSNINHGDWSATANSTLAQSWVSPSVTASASPSDMPLTGTFSFNNLSPSALIQEMTQAGVPVSPWDTRKNTLHNGVQLRSKGKDTCGLHVIINPESGNNGSPTSGTFHVDEVNPVDTSDPTKLAPAHAVMHGLVDVLPDLMEEHVWQQFPTGNLGCSANQR